MWVRILGAPLKFELANPQFIARNFHSSLWRQCPFHIIFEPPRYLMHVEQIFASRVLNLGLVQAQAKVDGVSVPLQKRIHV